MLQRRLKPLSKARKGRGGRTVMRDFQYRIKSAAEPHERVVKEGQLDRAG